MMDDVSNAHNLSIGMFKTVNVNIVHMALTIRMMIKLVNHVQLNYPFGMENIVSNVQFIQFTIKK